MTTVNNDEQMQAKEEKQYAAREILFHRRWLLTAIYVLMIALPLFLVLSTEGLLLAHFPFLNFAAFIRHRGAFPLSVAISGYTIFLIGVWINVAKYRRDQEKQAQEALLAERHRQMEGVWPPAPTKPE